MTKHKPFQNQSYPFKMASRLYWHHVTRINHFVTITWRPGSLATQRHPGDCRSQKEGATERRRSRIEGDRLEPAHGAEEDGFLQDVKQARHD